MTMAELDDLKEAVWRANRLLPAYGLVTLTWGNVSGFLRDRGIMVIKPSGVSYDALTVDDMVAVDLEGTRVDGRLKPSSDTPSHLVLYRAFPEFGGICHTHSPWATAWAQAGRPIPPLGTTHADHFYGPVPCTRALSADEVAGSYEHATGLVMAETIARADPFAVPGLLVAGHGPFTWGHTPEQAVEHALILETVAKMAAWTLTVNPDTPPLAQALLDRHYYRKHGPAAYYGQGSPA
jgi:L-ribulose-5-phosphate 4-epimerase